MPWGNLSYPLSPTECPRSLDPIFVVTYYMKWVKKTSWTYSKIFKNFLPRGNRSYPYSAGELFWRPIWTLSVQVPYRAFSREIPGVWSLLVSLSLCRVPNSNLFPVSFASLIHIGISQILRFYLIFLCSRVSSTKLYNKSLVLTFV